MCDLYVCLCVCVCVCFSGWGNICAYIYIYIYIYIFVFYIRIPMNECGGTDALYLLGVVGKSLVKGYINFKKKNNIFVIVFIVI